MNVSSTQQNDDSRSTTNGDDFNAVTEPVAAPVAPATAPATPPVVGPNTVSVQIPDGAQPGDTLQFHAHGQDLELVIPVGSQVGDVLEIQIVIAASKGENGREETDNVSSSSRKKKNNNNNNNNKNNTSSSFSLELTILNGRKTTLEFQSTLARNEEEEDSPVVEQKDGDGTFALPWQSGIHFARSWSDIQMVWSEQKLDPRSRILELGSGLGLVGISCGASVDKLSEYPFLVDKAEIVLSDLPAAMPLLDFNLEQNRNSLRGVDISTQSLPWTLESNPSPSSSQLLRPFDCILGSDLLYNLDSIPALVATIRRHLHPTRGIVLLAVRWRKPELERIFFEQLSDILCWELIPVTSLKCSLEWMEFGNPCNDKSNRYLHQTQISVKGIPTSLADISEDMVKDLAQEEFEVWESSFIQIFLGKPTTHTCTK